MDPLPATSSDSLAPAASTADRPAVAVPASNPIAPAPLIPDEEVLVQALIMRGLVTSDQVRMAQQYGSEHQRDLRQSILELNLISPELLNELAFDRLAARPETLRKEPFRSNPRRLCRCPRFHSIRIAPSITAKCARNCRRRP